MVYVANYYKKWIKKNPEYMKEWRKKNKEKLLEYHKKWAEEHPGYMVEHVNASRHKKPEYYRRYKREYARRKRLEEKLKKEIYEVKEMKYRNRKKHNFKRLKRQMRVYDYCLENISNHRTFTVDDIAKDLQIPRSTLVELLNELTAEKKLFYQRGYIEITNIGNNGCNDRLMRDRDGLIVKTIPRTTHNREIKKQEVYNYLCELVKNNQDIPCLTEMHKDRFENDMHITTLMEVLKQLDKEDKIIYRRGKIMAVYVKDLTKEKDTGKTLKYVKQEEPVEEEIMEEPEVIEEPEEIEEPTECVMEITDSEKFDKAVKELVVDYLNNADITTREEVVSYVDALYKITDKLKDKLY